MKQNPRRMGFVCSLVVLFVFSAGLPLAHAQAQATLEIINDTPSIYGGSTIYTPNQTQSISVFGSFFCTGGGCVVEAGKAGKWTISYHDNVIGIQWNIFRLASNGDICDNPCRQLQLDLTTCQTTQVRSGLCYPSDGSTPRWTPMITSFGAQGQCILQVNSSSHVDSYAPRCGCNYGAAPCQCFPADHNCAGVCPQDTSDVCGGDDTGCQYCPNEEVKEEEVKEEEVKEEEVEEEEVKEEVDAPALCTGIFVNNQCGGCQAYITSSHYSSATVLNSGCYDDPAIWGGARLWCGNTSSAGVTLFEATWSTDPTYGGIYWDVSALSGYNVPVTVKISDSKYYGPSETVCSSDDCCGSLDGGLFPCYDPDSGECKDCGYQPCQNHRSCDPPAVKVNSYLDSFVVQFC